jgi:hypothetical protein
MVLLLSGCLGCLLVAWSFL